jgi:hypothetical protein
MRMPMPDFIAEATEPEISCCWRDSEMRGSPDHVRGDDEDANSGRWCSIRSGRSTNSANGPPYDHEILNQ